MQLWLCFIEEMGETFGEMGLREIFPTNRGYSKQVMAMHCLNTLCMSSDTL